LLNKGLLEFYGFMLWQELPQHVRFGELCLYSFLIDEFHGDRRDTISIAKFDIFLDLPTNLMISVDFKMIELIASPIIDKGDQLFVIKKIVPFIRSDMLG
jgi:hemerythrin superfamily protein